MGDAELGVIVDLDAGDAEVVGTLGAIDIRAGAVEVEFPILPSD